jgi:hypothetical protein
VTDGSGRRGGCADPDLHPLPFRQHPQFAALKSMCNRTAAPIPPPNQFRSRSHATTGVGSGNPESESIFNEDWYHPSSRSTDSLRLTFWAVVKVKRAAGARKAAGLVVGLMIAASAMKRLDHSSDVTVF